VSVVPGVLGSLLLSQLWSRIVAGIGSPKVSRGENARECDRSC
jgi:hypothetical protein